MSREVIQDFLNSAGVVGISLTNRRMRPYFYGLDTVLDRTKQALGQGVLQVIENVPEGFESFEFYFAGHIVLIYKLTHGLVLLVLTDSDLKLVDYSRGITKIKHLIETDTYNTVSHFKLLLGSIPQQSLSNSHWNITAPEANDQEPSTIQRLTSSINLPNPEAIADKTSLGSVNARVQIDKQTNAIASPRASAIASNTNTQIQIQSNKNKPQTPPTDAATASSNTPIATNNPTQITDSSSKLVSAKSAPQEYKLDELLVALNKLSLFTTQYLGKVVVTNYWKSSRPASTWLSEFEIDRSGQITHPKQAAISCDP